MEFRRKGIRVDIVDAFVRNLVSNEDPLSCENVGTLKARYTKKIFNFRPL